MDHRADMADLEEATEVLEAAMVAQEEDSMEAMATVVAVVDTITTAAVTAKATAEEEAVSVLEDGVARTRVSCKSALFFLCSNTFQVPSPIVPSC